MEKHRTISLSVAQLKNNLLYELNVDFLVPGVFR